MRLGLNKEVKLLVFFLVFSTSAFSQSLRNHKYRIGSAMDKSSITASDHSLTINYSIGELDAESFIDDNGTWFRIGIPGHIPASEIGKPEMPVLSRLIVIPDGYSYKIRITEPKSQKIRPSAKRIRGNLYPVQEGETKNIQKEKPQFRIDKDVYARKDFIKSDTVRIEPLGKARKKNLATLSISPVRYNPGSNVLEVITSMKIEIIFTATGSGDPKALLPESLLFGGSLEKGILNYNPEDLITGYSDKPVRMIILTDTAFRKHLEPFIRWKTQKGFRLDILYRGAAFAGDNYADIRNSIAEIYNSSTEENPPPEYLLIVGNVAKIPYYGTGNITDLYYGEFDGGADYFPEMFIGRLPVADTNDLKTVVSKIVQYEKFEFADTNSFHLNALATAGVDDSHATHMNGQVNYGVTNYLTPANRINEYHFLYPDARKDSIIKLINRGLSFINYTGHGSSTGWLYLNITNSDVPSLTNRNMYPFVVSNACQTSRFNSASFGNTLVLAPQKGAIGYVGCSADSYWDEDYFWAVGVGPIALNPTYESTGLGALDRLFHNHGESPSDWYTSMGQVIYAGNLAVSASTTSKKKYYWEIYNLVGDPSIIPIIGTPDSFNIALPDNLPNNIRSYSFIADPFAYIAVSHFDTLWDASFVSPSGSVTLEMPGLSDDSCLVVITGQNKVPLIKTIYFSDFSGEYINLSGYAINDSLGNDDGKADYNETLFLKLTVGNLGLAAATGVTAQITTSSEFVTINSGTANIGDLPPGTEKVLYNNLSFTLSGNVPDNAAVTFDLTLKYGSVEKKYKTDIYIHSPELEIINYIIDDTETGNSNYIADPGETFRFIFQVRNLGTSNASGQFNISSPDPEISLLEPSKNSGTLNSGEIIAIPLMAKISESVPSGTAITVSALLDCDPFFASKNISFRIGRYQETFESASFKVFPWINSSSKPWTITVSDPYEGIIAAKSGAIPDNQTTSLSIKANYASDDSLRFYYKVSSESGYDHLIFRLNNTEIFRRSGEIPWERRSVGIPAGINTMEWLYKKDGSVSGGDDCAMIDLIDFAKASPVTYIARDIMAARLIAPIQTTNMKHEYVSLKLLSLGPDTIKGFNLAYSINEGIPVVEHFDKNIIYNGDSVAVTFNAKADLSHYGDYNIVVYSLNNNDDYLQNDTLRTRIKNLVRRVTDNIRIDAEDPILLGPNPFTDELNILIKSEAEDTVHISMISAEGKKVLDLVKQHLVPGTNSFLIDNIRLEPAIYFMRFDFSGFTKTIKVVKLKQ